MSVAGVAACAGPPSSGPIAHASLNHDANQISIQSKGPYPGMRPARVVNWFLAALTGDDHDPTFARAKLFMNSDVADEWTADKSISSGQAVIFAQSPVVTSESADPPTPSASPSGSKAGLTTTVTVSGVEMATRTSLGFYVPTNPTKPRSMTLKLVTNDAGDWRIASKPDFRVLGIGDFRRAIPAPLPVYQPVPATFASSSAPVDQVYLTPSTPEITFGALVNAVLRGRRDDPAPVSHTTFDPSTGVVTVQLDAAPKGDTRSVENALLQTFQAASVAPQSVGSSLQFTGMRLNIAGRAAGALRFPSELAVASTFPPVYFTDGKDNVLEAEATGPAVGDALRPRLVTALVGGVENRTFGPIAVLQDRDSPDDVTRVKDGPQPVTIAALVTRGPGLGDIRVGSVRSTKASAGSAVWYHTPQPDRVSDIEWDPIDGSLWVVEDGKVYNVQPPAGDQISKPVPVNTFNGGDYRRIRFSPDGQRIVAVTSPAGDGSSGATAPDEALIQTVSRPDGSGSTYSLSQGLALLPAKPGPDQSPFALKQILDASWAGSRTIVLLGKEQDDSPTKLYKIYSDGSQDTRLLDGIEEAEAQATKIAAEVLDSGAPLLRIFSNGQTDATQKQNGIYWKGRTFDLFQPQGDNPVVATVMVR